MEKFTVDIDKVLDDFEFNEYKALEIPQNTSTESYSTVSSTHNESANVCSTYEDSIATYHNSVPYQPTTTSNYYNAHQQCNSLPFNTDYTNSYAISRADFKTSESQGNNFIIKSDQLYENAITADEKFATEMLKIHLFKENNKHENNIYSNSEFSKQKLTSLPATKKNSVSNVFNSLQEYINTDVDVPDVNIQNTLVYPQLLPKVDNEQKIQSVQINQDDTAAGVREDGVEEHSSEVEKPVESNCQIDDVISTEITVLERGENVLLPVENCEEHTQKIPETTSVLDSVDAILEIQKDTSNEHILDSSIEHDQILEKTSEEVQSKEQCDVVVDEKTQILSDLCENSDKVMSDMKVDSNLIAPIENCLENGENNRENREIESEIVDNEVDVRTENKAISFDDIDVDISDTEIDEYLRDVEEEEEDLEEERVVDEEVKSELCQDKDLSNKKTDNYLENVNKVQEEEMNEENGNLTEDCEDENKINDAIIKSDNESAENNVIKSPAEADLEEQENKCEKSRQKLSNICRPNSLDIVSSLDEDDIALSKAPPGETPMIKDVIKIEQDIGINKMSENDFSPSTSEVSSVENQEGCILNGEINSSLVPSNTGYDNHSTLGKRPPYWIPDTDTNFCMHCGFKFTVIKRRHHCRACGMVLCSKCCNMKAKLEYLGNILSRVCIQCYEILNKDNETAINNNVQDNTSSDSATNSPAHISSQNQGTQPNPNNPMEYCSTVPPLKQIENQRPRSPPTVMVPVGVLKRQGSNKGRSEKTVMFSDGIRPGCDLTELDDPWESRPPRRQNKRLPTPPGQISLKINRNLPPVDPKTLSYIPFNDSCLPPTVNFSKPENTYTECSNNENVVEMLRNETLVFAIQRNFNIHVKIVNLDCCVNKQVWCFSTRGLSSVGQDEIVILLETLEKENRVPKDVFLHLNKIYNDASKGNTITEMGFSIENSANFLNSKSHAGFLYVRATYQCLQNVILPEAPYLFGILIHRWETPWVKIFPLRLLLRLGAEYRYYPCPIISTRNRESVFVEIGHTIINLLADFTNYSYTLPSVRGLLIHMEERKTSVLIPKNRYDQVMKALNNSSDHILAFAGNFSSEADSHLVCIQDLKGTNENAYSTHAINIQDKPRKVTGASFIILNGALKTSSGLTAKSSIIEDGLMIHILPDQMVKLRDNLRNMKPFQISCGCVNTESDEHVNIVWCDNDINFNIGVKSPIDHQPMDGIPSIRVHNGVDHVGSSKLIRWTEAFILQNGEENSKTQDPIDISKLSESISRATCEALVKYLELLATNNLSKVGIRVTLHSENVAYEAGSNGNKLAPIYMNSLDNALIPILHNITSKTICNDPIVLELIFHILSS